MAPDPEWSNAELRETAMENRGVGADARLPDEIRFLWGVTRTIRNRRREAEPNSDSPPAIFLLAPTVPDSVDVADVVEHPWLDNGLTALEGTVWFVTEVASRGRGLTLDVDIDDDGLVKLVTDELEMGTVPAIVYDTRTNPPHARFYADGLSSESYTPVRLSSQPITMDEIFRIIDRVYEQCLVTPGIQIKAAKVWQKAGAHWAAEEAEGRIQASIQTGLVGAFSSCVVRAEQVQATGRLDLEIEEPADDDASEIVRHALLELKVLRARGSTGRRVTAATNETAVEDGVRQAASYRDDKGHRVAALCCFDMRETFTGEECFQKVAIRARRLKVRLGAWHLFGTAADYQRHRT